MKKKKKTNSKYLVMVNHERDREAEMRETGRQTDTHRDREAEMRDRQRYERREPRIRKQRLALKEEKESSS